MAGVAGGLFALGCAADRPMGPGSERLVLSATSTDLMEGGSVSLRVQVDGRDADARDVQWTSRDPSTLTVDGMTARGLAPGVTYLVARVGGLTDSLRLAVRFSGLGPNRVGVRLAGDVQQQTTLGGAALQWEDATRIASSLVFATAGRRDPTDSDPFAGDTALTIHFPGAMSLGTSTLAAMQVRQDPASGGLEFIGGAGVILRILDPDGSVRFYVAVNASQVEITSLAPPDELGSLPGSVSGRVWFEAAGLRWRPNPSAPGMILEPIGNTTVQLYMEFNSQLFRVPIPRLTGAVAGTPYAGTLLGGAEARMIGSTLRMEYLQLLDPQAETPTIHHLELDLTQPATGTFSIAPGTAVSGSAFFAPFIRDIPGVNIGQIGPTTDAILSSGTVTITSYRAPTDNVYGELSGTLNASLTFPTQPTYAVNVQFTFRTPIDPLLGPPVR